MKFTKIGSLQRVGVPSVDLYRIVDSDGLVALLTRDELVELYVLLEQELTVVTNTEREPVTSPLARERAAKGDTFGAIAAVRAWNDCSLAKAKECVLKYMSDNNIPTP